MYNYDLNTSSVICILNDLVLFHVAGLKMPAGCGDGHADAPMMDTGTNAYGESAHGVEGGDSPSMHVTSSANESISDPLPEDVRLALSSISRHIFDFEG